MFMKRAAQITLGAAWCVAAAAIVAKEAAPLAEDPAIEHQVMEISKELRCLVCQNQTIADSSAELAVDLRREVRDMVKQGMDQQQIVAFMEDRYGDFVRYRPSFKASTLMLWLGPFALFALALGVLFTNMLRKRKTVNESQPLTSEEQRRVTTLLTKRDAAGDVKS